jgi:hypothetical protein
MFIDMQFSSPLGNFSGFRKSDDVCVSMCEEVDSFIAKYSLMLDVWTLQ